MDTVLLMILLVFEMLKIPRVKAEARFLKKIAFLSKKFLQQDAFGKCTRTTVNLSKFTAVHE